MLQRLTHIRAATVADLEAIRQVYNEGIEDRVATLDLDPKTKEEILEWWSQHDDRFAVIVAANEQGGALGWASLNQFSHRCAHAQIADLSVYVSRSQRGRGIGFELLQALEGRAREGRFHKIVLHALNTNDSGKRLYRKAGFSEVGVFKEHGLLDGTFVDVVAMEKLL